MIQGAGQKPPSKSFEQIRAEQLEYNARREKGYRERALKLYPWICGRCAREFERKNLSELTVLENLVRYGSTKDAEVKPATYNPFADLKAKMEEKS